MTEYVAGSTRPYHLPWWAEASRRYKGRDARTLTRFRPGLMKPKLWARAQELGHDMSPWFAEMGEDDKRIESWVSQCESCELWMGLTGPDPEDEQDGTYGSCLVVKCEGRGTRAHWTREEEHELY